MEAAMDAIPATMALANAYAAAADSGDQGTKKRGKMNLLRVAMYMLRKSSDKPKPATTVVPRGTWKKLFASMRLLHLHESTQSAHLDVGGDEGAEKINNHAEFEDDVMASPVSPYKSPSSSASSSYGGDSRYTSALDLQELDKGCNDDQNETDDEKFDDSRGDAMIDVKAELFIANFYENMRLQHEGMINH